MTSLSSPPEGGFVRVPHAWISLPITPPSKALLVALCAYADPKGRSWCSLEQLGEILGRSKASISAYIKELQEAGIIACRNQTFGNGYNYRLLITLVGWKDLLAHWSGLTARKAATKTASDQSVAKKAGTPFAAPAQAPCPIQALTDTAQATHKTDIKAQLTERSVQHAECKDPSGPITNIYQTKTPQLVWSDEDEAAWKKFRAHDDDEACVVGLVPSQHVLSKVIAIAATKAQELGSLSEDRASVEARIALEEFAQKRSLEIDEASLTASAITIASFSKSKRALDAAIAALDAVWKPHWKRLSGEWQITQTCKPAADAAKASRAVLSEAGKFQKRAWIAKTFIKSAIAA